MYILCMRQRKIIVDPILRREQGRRVAHHTRSYKNAELENKIKKIAKLGLRPNSPSTRGQVSMLVGLGIKFETATKLTKKRATAIIKTLVSSS
jgi:hypothetical protein